LKKSRDRRFILFSSSMAAQVLFLLLILVLACASTTASVIGLNAGAQFDTSMVPYVVQSGAKWVRLNFIITSDQYGTG
jgi:hypothetical protein